MSAWTNDNMFSFCSLLSCGPVSVPLLYTRYIRKFLGFLFESLCLPKNFSWTFSLSLIPQLDLFIKMIFWKFSIMWYTLHAKEMDDVTIQIILYWKCTMTCVLWALWWTFFLCIFIFTLSIIFIFPLLIYFT